MTNSIHLITYSNGTCRNTGVEYSKTQDLLVNSIQSKTKYDVVFHTHTLETIKEKEWFTHIENFPDVNHNKQWSRDGYYNCWKPFLIKDAYNDMGDDDVLYYIDSSGYHSVGFDYEIDKLIEYCYRSENVCGSFGPDVKNNSFGCCDNIDIWNHIYPDMEYSINKVLNKFHILNSYILFSKSNNNYNFINDWIKYCTDLLNNFPLITYHHTIDQSIFNVLVYKYGFKSFFNHIPHLKNKNHNLIHEVLNSAGNRLIDEYFINPIKCNI